jgi:hypothetical protein
MAGRIQTLWAVTSGEYSDYRVIAMFEREEDARAALEAGLAGDYCPDVTQLPYFPAGVKPRRVTVHRAAATAYRKGKLADVAVRTYSEVEWVFGQNPAPQRPRVRESRWANGSAIGVVVECANAELAEKALRDRLARLYAEFAGVADA